MFSQFFAAAMASKGHNSVKVSLFFSLFLSLNSRKKKKKKIPPGMFLGEIQKHEFKSQVEFFFLFFCVDFFLFVLTDCCLTGHSQEKWLS